MRNHIASLFLMTLLAACGSPPAKPPADPASDFKALGIAHASAPMPNVYCSGQPTKEQFQKLRAAGVQRFITLRPANEEGSGWEEQVGAELGIAVTRIPVAGPKDLTPANVALLQQAMADGACTLVACGSSNRVGAMMALKARAEGSNADAALAFGKVCGLTRLEPQVRELLAK